MIASFTVITSACPPWLKWLVKREILKYVRLNLSGERKEVGDQYLASEMHLEGGTLDGVVSFACSRLRFSLNGEVLTISLDETLSLPHTPYKASSIINLIDSGNMQIQGTHIISDALRYLEQNINKILFERLM